MKVMQVNTNNYNPQFRRIQVDEGGKEILGAIAEVGNYEGLKNVFREAAENLAADIYIGRDGVKVIDCLTKEIFIPSGELLKDVKAGKAWFREVGLLSGSSKQVYPFGKTDEKADYLYIDNKIVKSQGFFSEAEKEPVYFTPEKPDSYIVRHDNYIFGVSYFAPEKRELYPVGDEFTNSVIERIEAARRIAFNIKYYADYRKPAEPTEVSPATREFVDELVEQHT